MKYILTNQPQKINETKGEIENLSVRHTIVLAAGTSIPSVGTSTITVRPGESYPFKTILGEALYAWIINANDDETLEVSVINFPSEGEGGDTDISAIETEIINQGKQLQNCLVELGTPEHPLVGGVSAKDGMFYKVECDAPISHGRGTVFDPNGFNGVINEKDGSIHIGSGYTRIKISSAQNRSDSVITENTDDFGKKVTASGGTNLGCLLLKGNTPNATEGYFGRVKIRNNGTVPFKIRLWNEESSEITVGAKETIDYKGVTKRLTEQACMFSFTRESLTDTLDVSYKEDMFLYHITEEKPFVPNTAPNGRLIICEPWTSETHSFIVECEGKGSGNSYFLSNSFESIKNPSSKSAGKYYGVISKSYKKIIYEDLTTSTPEDTKIYLHKNLEIGRGGGSAKMHNIKKMYKTLIFEGDMTEAGFLEEIKKIKSEKYLIPQKFIGTPHDIPYMPRKCDDNGLTYPGVKVDKNRDLEVLEKETRWEILKLSDDTISYASVKKVGEVWTINGALDSVSGMIRTQYPAKIRRL